MDGSHIAALGCISATIGILVYKKDYFHAGICAVCFTTFFILGFVQ